MFLVTFLLYDNQAVCVTENSDVFQYLSDYFPQSTFYLFCFPLSLCTEGPCSLKHLVSSKGHYQAQGGSPACPTPVASSWAIFLRTRQPFHPWDIAFFPELQNGRLWGHKIGGFHGTKLRKNQVRGWYTKAHNKGWPHLIKGLRGKVNQKNQTKNQGEIILTSNMTAPIMAQVKGDKSHRPIPKGSVWMVIVKVLWSECLCLLERPDCA